MSAIVVYFSLTFSLLGGWERHDPEQKTVTTTRRGIYIGVAVASNF
jgi:hypothetical protein